ncbi:energy-coupling factor ABC transporter ATP-binding protein [Nocardiopsis composta]|uniref:Energy-coupling factor transport system ATP-binding protein n=1 Tax=Nocardiopsis composta TaxID=157465 RepID=A0A7W8VHC9_9ACTN|nr:ABC transporter ATP-binding protein [Nocardiopsis composta]MBB5436103.1 energy-coupling factor transport system ATP-binding protein [Nocardiopsis composta]
MTPAVHIEGLVYAYPGGVTALNGVDLRIEHGERVAVIGRNGAGKTTMARQLNGIAKPTAGTVTVCGTDTAGATTARLAASVGYVFQNPSDQIFAKTVRADVEFGPRNLGRSAEETARLAEAAMAATDVLDFADHHPYHLSPAERKRVALASVLAMDTPVVVLDEPTTGQDHRSVRRIERIVADLHAAGTTVIAITHDMDFCAESFDRVVAMAQGRVIADGTPAEVFARPEELELARVEPPQISRLAAELGWADQVTTVDGFVEELSRRAGGEAGTPGT